MNQDDSDCENVREYSVIDRRERVMGTDSMIKMDKLAFA